MSGTIDAPIARGAPGLLRAFTVPGWLCALGFVAALTAILQLAVRAYVPGSLEAGGLSLENFRGLAHPTYRAVFAQTVAICAATAVLSLLLGYPLAWALARTRRPWWRAFMLVLIVTPLFLGEVVRTYGWIVVLGQGGFVNAVLAALGFQRQAMLFTVGGVLAALVHVTLPITVIMLAAALSHIETDYERAAQSLGAGPIRSFLTVMLPLSLPGILAAGTTAFAWTFSAFATPQLIGGGRVNMVSTLVYQLGFASFNFPFASALAVAGLVLTALSLAMVRLLTARLERRL